MKKTILMLAVVMGVLSTACKKQNTVTVTKTNTVTVHDTIHDTIVVNPASLINLWTCYKVDNINNSVSSPSTVNWKFLFSSSQFSQDLDLNGTFENVYNASYGTGYVDIYFTASPTTYSVLAVGNEFRLTRIISSTQSQVWYLKP